MGYLDVPLQLSLNDNHTLVYVGPLGGIPRDIRRAFLSPGEAFQRKHGPGGSKDLHDVVTAVKAVLRQHGYDTRTMVLSAKKKKSLDDQQC